MRIQATERMDALVGIQMIRKTNVIFNIVREKVVLQPKLKEQQIHGLITPVKSKSNRNNIHS